MNQIESLIHLFTHGHFNISEDFYTLKIEIRSQNINIPTVEELKKVLLSFPADDHIILDIILLDSGQANINTISCNTDTLNIDGFINQLNDLYNDTEDTDVFKLKLFINKNIHNNIINIYYIDAFFSYLFNLSITEIFNDFNELCSTKLYFNLINSNITFSSGYIQGGKYNSLDTNSNITNDNIYSIDSNFLQRGQYSNISPKLFYLTTRCEIEQYNELFDKLSYILMLTNICNFSTIAINNITIQLEGYTLIKNSIDFKLLQINGLDELKLIYNWIYSSENYADKLGLARNIISLSLNNNNLFALKDGVFNSIKSNYKIYLKENVKQYIKVKNTITDNLFILSQKSNDYCESFAKSFKTNLTSLFTFFITVIIINILSGTKTNTTLFTKEVFCIIMLFITISIIYLIFLRYEKRLFIKRLKNSYLRIKNQYTELLNKDDINNIFNNSKILPEDIKHVNMTVRMYTICWLIILLIIAIIVCILTFTNTCHTIWNILGNILIFYYQHFHEYISFT
ncbi:hypothetical protein [Vallitalea guaymasensis]|uniref:hypothetical protein n=1 Tax=Vallitalea guaymasensis TaxID=1185412 RepID=UPI000DE4098D|nr:hypothetical protein [Vallitalea guaymasensis]